MKSSILLIFAYFISANFQVSAQASTLYTEKTTLDTYKEQTLLSKAKMVFEWLKNNMCDGDEERVNKIVRTFSNHT